MYARVVNAAVAPGRLDEAVQLWRESVAPSAKQQQGFKDARLFLQRKTGRITSMGLWETEADLLGSINWNQGQLDTFAALFAISPEVELYEVAAEA